MARLLAVLAGYAQCVPEAVADARVHPMRLLLQVRAAVVTDSMHCLWTLWADDSLNPSQQVLALLTPRLMSSSWHATNHALKGIRPIEVNCKCVLVVLTNPASAGRNAPAAGGWNLYAVLLER